MRRFVGDLAHDDVEISNSHHSDVLRRRYRHWSIGFVNPAVDLDLPDRSQARDCYSAVARLHLVIGKYLDDSIFCFQREAPYVFERNESTVATERQRQNGISTTIPPREGRNRQSL